MRRFRVCRTHNEDRGEVCRPLREAAGSILGSAVGWGVEGESCAGQSSFFPGVVLFTDCCPVFLCHLCGVAQRHTQTRARRGERSAACVPPIYTSNVRIRRDLISRFDICHLCGVLCGDRAVTGQRRAPHPQTPDPLRTRTGPQSPNTRRDQTCRRAAHRT